MQQYAAQAAAGAQYGQAASGLYTALLPSGALVALPAGLSQGQAVATALPTASASLQQQSSPLSVALAGAQASPLSPSLAHTRVVGLPAQHIQVASQQPTAQQWQQQQQQAAWVLQQQVASSQLVQLGLQQQQQQPQQAVQLLQLQYHTQQQQQQPSHVPPVHQQLLHHPQQLLQEDAGSSPQLLLATGPGGRGWGGQHLPHALYPGGAGGGGGGAGIGGGRSNRGGRGRGSRAGSAGPSHWRPGGPGGRGPGAGGGPGGRPGMDAVVQSVFATLRQLPRGQPAHEAVGDALVGLDGRSMAALAKQLAAQGMAAVAWELFEWLRGLGPQHDLVRLLDVYLYTAMISACSAHRRDLDVALGLSAEMAARGVPRNVHTFSALMNVAIKAGQYGAALEVWREMEKARCRANVGVGWERGWAGGTVVALALEGWTAPCGFGGCWLESRPWPSSSVSRSWLWGIGGG